MSVPRSRVARVCHLLNGEEARYVVVGATAMQLWGTSRATRDVDILIESTIENAERVSLQHLIESKRTGRTQDAADIEVLETLQRMHGDAR